MLGACPSVKVAWKCGQIPEAFPFQVGTLPFLVVLTCELCFSVSKDLAPDIPEIIRPAPTSAFPLTPILPKSLQVRGLPVFVSRMSHIGVWLCK